ncbi:MAG: DNA gyrase modulator, partial [Roseobacter sp.]|nr:DNA gyrase modulator [Roseobacter sp.]
MTLPLSELTQKLLVAAKAAGADAADAMTVRGTSQSIEVRNGTLEQAERAEGVDIGLRVFVGQRNATVSASDTRDSTIEQMALRAVAMAHEAPEDPYCGLADPDQTGIAVDVDALQLCDLTP